MCSARVILFLYNFLRLHLLPPSELVSFEEIKIMLINWCISSTAATRKREGKTELGREGGERGREGDIDRERGGERDRGREREI